MEQFDVIVIGSGQGGVPFAVSMARAGKKVVLFEKDKLGGTCLNVGCYPSKAFLGAAFAGGNREQAASWGVGIERLVDFAKLMEMVRSKRDSSYIKDALDHAGVTTVMAEASFSGERQVTAAGVDYQAPVIVINTGNAPFIPPVEGLSGTPFMTYRDFWELDELPKRILVMGGGYIGVELGQGLARLGSEVHIVEMAPRLASREDEDLTGVLQAALQADGVRLHLGKKAGSVSYTAGLFSVGLDSGQVLEGDKLLVVVGQQANTKALNAGSSGIELTERGFVKTDDRFESSCPGVYAIGDVTGQPAFTHVSWEDHRRLLSILEGGNRRQGDRVLGYAFYTEPEVGRCGLTLSEAKDKGLDAKEVSLQLEHVARAWLVDRTEGFYRLVVEQGSGRILGATIVGPRGGELVHCILDLMEAGAGWHQLERAVHIHPTFAEGLPTLARRLL